MLNDEMGPKAHHILILIEKSKIYDGQTVTCIEQVLSYYSKWCELWKIGGWNDKNLRDH